MVILRIVISGCPGGYDLYVPPSHEAVALLRTSVCTPVFVWISAIATPEASMNILPAATHPDQWELRTIEPLSRRPNRLGAGISISEDRTEVVDRIHYRVQKPHLLASPPNSLARAHSGGGPLQARSSLKDRLPRRASGDKYARVFLSLVRNGCSRVKTRNGYVWSSRTLLDICAPGFNLSRLLSPYNKLFRTR